MSACGRHMNHKRHVGYVILAERTLYGSFLMGKRCLKIKETVPPGTDRAPLDRARITNEYLTTFYDPICARGKM
ncbi:unnamed protein product [Lasius platythorax]|uniref:Uncharacterized protein n=1 Tax=Lasius platythorax TaxID=488582 RepID=A0AAV2NXG0_9HYME